MRYNIKSQKAIQDVASFLEFKLNDLSHFNLHLDKEY